MRLDEYQRMRDVEDSHWRYVALRGLVADALERHATMERERMIDLGCGTGAFLHAFGDDKSMGFDRSHEALRLAQGRGCPRIVQGDLQALPFADESSGTLLCVDVLYHDGVAKPRAALLEMSRVLRPGGIAIVVVPAFKWLRGAHDDVVQGGRRFTPRELRSLMEDAGLDPVWLSCWLTLLLPMVWATRVASRWRSGPPKSDLEARPSDTANKLLGWIMQVERRLLTRTSLPFGTSIICVARKPEST